MTNQLVGLQGEDDELQTPLDTKPVRQRVAQTQPLSVPMHTVQQIHWNNIEGAIMNIIKDEPATLKRARRITLELAPGEAIINVREGRYYRLGGQVDDIVQSHVITEMTGVYWCSVSQKWEEA
jgi:hypothetical protein